MTRLFFLHQQDPNTELKVVKEKLKENEQHVEILKAENTRWQEEFNELNLKCQSLEAQLEQKTNEHRQAIQAKEVRNYYSTISAI